MVMLRNPSINQTFGHERSSLYISYSLKISKGTCQIKDMEKDSTRERKAASLVATQVAGVVLGSTYVKLPCMLKLI